MYGLRKALIALLLFAAPASAEVPTVNIPIQLRQANWSVWTQGHQEGSCVHAAIVNLFRWQQQYERADNWLKTNGGGEYADDTWNQGENLARKFDAAGIPYAYTTTGDVSFLEWAVATRRGCGMTVMGGRHMVVLVGLDAQYAWILDTNQIDRFIRVDRTRLVAEWQASHGWAVTPIKGTPTPPIPFRKER